MFDKRLPKRFWYLSVALLCFGVVVIWARGGLGTLIHPRYHFFSAFLCLVGAIILLHAAFSYHSSTQTTIEFDSYPKLIGMFLVWFLKRGSWLIVGTLIVIYIIPQTPLLSQAATQRFVDKQTDPQTIREASWFSQPTQLYQLSEVLKVPQGIEQQTGKEYEFTGFVRAPKDGDVDTFLLSRFVMSCCAVDAVPSGVLVHATNWQNNYPIDTWVRVKGIVEQVNIGGLSKTVLTPQHIEKIPTPDDPYDYITF